MRRRRHGSEPRRLAGLHLRRRQPVERAERRKGRCRRSRRKGRQGRPRREGHPGNSGAGRFLVRGFRHRRRHRDSLRRRCRGYAPERRRWRAGHSGREGGQGRHRCSRHPRRKGRQGRYRRTRPPRRERGQGRQRRHRCAGRTGAAGHPGRNGRTGPSGRAGHSGDSGQRRFLLHRDVDRRRRDHLLWRRGRRYALERHERPRWC